ncbi:indole-3-glycerol phosphate synthase/indole-3-glycerol phosphate synthase/phosphoribosylanthranilate isomerase/anthranilate synthase/indole-3-glycerol phosphate synthase/phosphoribosylanthranilate isomerase [Gracilibacillus halotolerans]|uniref:Indole-3-glycerol phosphate synthase n=1 Tax=Gracilibacillus halotolerans TaxID=74386 RepID=A0A841RFW8_9BACI|nr:indole-3-glycerol phosphate synthase TrpC [Gracilibacillus halotolerans]MBB6513000.1 indole-3-glycerol phosphate synthase/indole-3-glycerol phosphate synthase/phosphoribosylanthranilate isomerase/anthranilate synthase/indole-3-glycerol phosphate synthase/phosphoribosylanthranilate isomerase [Gracilibacillus halotolerans]
MTTILDKILAEKEKEVARLKETYVPGTIKEKRVEVSLYDTFMKSDRMSIIAEIKRASPSKGLINDQVNPQEQGVTYEEYGAGGISVLTDEPFFQGTIEDMQQVRQKVNIPVLNKDFIIDEIQIDRAYDAGANLILLIAAALPEERLKELYAYAEGKGLEILFEVHTEEELEVAKRIGAKIVGVNNRDLKTFNVDLAVTEKLASLIDTSSTLLISESGMKDQADVERVMRAGAKGILVGETMMRSDNLKATFDSLRIPLGE